LLRLLQVGFNIRLVEDVLGSVPAVCPLVVCFGSLRTMKFPAASPPAGGSCYAYLPTCLHCHLPRAGILSGGGRFSEWVELVLILVLLTWFCLSGITTPFACCCYSARRFYKRFGRDAATGLNDVTTTYWTGVAAPPRR
jgi:hypothetical protein